MRGRQIVLVVAVAQNGAIGRGGGLPWRVQADLRRFRSLTMGKPILMGRATFESIGRVLDGRDSIVLTRQPGFTAPGILVAHGMAAALDLAEKCAAMRGAPEICVIGGAQVFTDALPLADRLHVTHVESAPPGDVFFPAISDSEWIEVSREKLPFSPGDTASAEYAVYERR